MSAHRHEGRVGARAEVVETTDQAYGEHTFVAPSKAGPAVLPSERFMGSETLTVGEWERRHAATYGTDRDGGEVHPGTPPVPAVATPNRPTSAPGRTHQAGRSLAVPPGPSGRGAGSREGEPGGPVMSSRSATPSHQQNSARTGGSRPGA